MQLHRKHLAWLTTASTMWRAIWRPWSRMSNGPSQGHEQDTVDPLAEQAGRSVKNHLVR